MANSRKPPPPDLAAIVGAALRAHVAPGARIAVALSGGVDSVVLLDLLAGIAPRRGIALSVLHVHHGLSPNADAWLEFCRDLAAGYALPFSAERVDVGAYRGLGPEGAARAARYAAFGRAACDGIALAHHQDDQAETVLLQLLRGGGVAGLAAMPAARAAACGPRLLRPLLGAARADILDYAVARGLRWVDDESNDDPALDRNRIRHHVLPALRELRPDAAARIARSAGALAETAQLLDALATTDEARCLRADRLDVTRLAALDAVRGRNVLRHYLARHGVPRLDAVELIEIWRQLTKARRDAQPVFRIGAVQVLRYDDRVFVEPDRDDPGGDFFRAWNGEMSWAIPELGGRLDFLPRVGGGIAGDALARGAQVRLRRGGERLRLAAGGPRRALKSLLQEARVPPWERRRVPLVYCGGELACVPGIGVDISAMAQPGQPGFELHWRARDDANMPSSRLSPANSGQPPTITLK